MRRNKHLRDNIAAKMEVIRVIRDPSTSHLSCNFTSEARLSYVPYTILIICSPI